MVRSRLLLAATVLAALAVPGQAWAKFKWPTPTASSSSSSTGGSTGSSGMTATGGASGSSGGSSGGTPVPEPSDFAIFALGIAGLLVGRRGARKRG